MNKRIYLDNGATIQVSEEVLGEMLPYLPGQSDRLVPGSFHPSVSNTSYYIAPFV